MTKKEILEVKHLLATTKRIVIVSHKNPDGDAIGSTLGLYHYLTLKGYDAVVIMPNDYPEFLKWIPGEDSILIYENELDKANDIIRKAEIIFTLDLNSLDRTGLMEAALSASNAIKIMIDHHPQPDTYARYTYSDVSICSTSEMIYHFLEKLDDVKAVNKPMATCLYVGIMTDTGSFRFSATTSTTHRVIATLIDKGIDHAQIHNEVYDNNSYNKIQLLGRSLDNLTVIPEFKTAYIFLTQDDLNQFNFKKGDTEGLVNYGLTINNVIFSVIFIENKKEDIIKISLRSKKNFDVNIFARNHFDGGGHINAAGGRSELNLKDTIEKFINVLPQYQKELNS